MTHFIFSENPVQITISPEETLLLGNEIGKALKKEKKPQPIALLGDLGSGKTTLAKGIIQGLTQIDPNNITSPTFQYASLFYDGMKSIRVAHCDLWRLSSEEEFLNLGLGDLFDGVEYFPEIVIVGRSNAGKSTLINSLLQYKGMAKVSKRPGKTIMLNLFQIGEWLSIADLPGYGYAKVSQQEKRLSEQEIPKYMRDRESLTMILIVMDIRRSIELEERMLFQSIQENPRIENCIFVATKADKLAGYERINRERALTNDVTSLMQTAKRPNLAVILSSVSSTKGDGIGELRKSMENSFMSSRIEK
ncbi:hypothetical protein ACTFIY_002702 [Dictyostelium cf. discoideum]